MLPDSKPADAHSPAISGQPPHDDGIVGRRFGLLTWPHKHQMNDLQPTQENTYGGSIPCLPKRSRATSGQVLRSMVGSEHGTVLGVPRLRIRQHGGLSKAPGVPAHWAWDSGAVVIGQGGWRGWLGGSLEA
jgi:hypothetical protein